MSKCKPQWLEISGPNFPIPFALSCTRARLLPPPTCTSFPWYNLQHPEPRSFTSVVHFWTGQNSRKNSVSIELFLCTTPWACWYLHLPPSIYNTILFHYDCLQGGEIDSWKVTVMWCDTDVTVRTMTNIQVSWLHAQWCLFYRHCSE